MQGNFIEKDFTSIKEYDNDINFKVKLGLPNNYPEEYLDLNLITGNDISFGNIQNLFKKNINPHIIDKYSDTYLNNNDNFPEIIEIVIRNLEEGRNYTRELKYVGIFFENFEDGIHRKTIYGHIDIEQFKQNKEIYGIFKHQVAYNNIEMDILVYCRLYQEVKK